VGELPEVSDRFAGGWVRDAVGFSRYNSDRLIGRNILAGILIVAAVAGAVFSLSVQKVRARLAAEVEPAEIVADGYQEAVLTVSGPEKERPTVTLLGNALGVKLGRISWAEVGWKVKVRSGVQTGSITLQAVVDGRPPVEARLRLKLDEGDLAGDGTPDFLRLDEQRDQEAFRRWFTFLAEVQFFMAPKSRPAEIKDCSSLIRYAYREALREHGGDWAEAARLPVLPALSPVSKYNYPHTPLEADLFRVKPGPFRAVDLKNGSYLQFADAETLWRYNTHPVGRELRRALPGDMLFFRRSAEQTSFHSMIYLGRSQVQPDRREYVVYHTGPDGDDPGRMKRLTVEELLNYPQPGWRPVRENRAFLGIGRWNILKPTTVHNQGHAN